MALADWDPRLITPGRALQLAGDWPVYFDAGQARLSQYEPEAGGQRLADQWQVNCRCGKDHQSITMLGRFSLREDGAPEWVEFASTTVGDLLSDVLRHMVTAHDLSLSGGSHE